MTTGRINQVTIVLATFPASERGRSRLLLRGVRAPDAAVAPPGVSLGGSSEMRHPIAATEFPRAGSAREFMACAAKLEHIRPKRRLPVAGHARRRIPVHRRTPECV